MDHSQRPSTVNLNYHFMLMEYCLANRLGFVPDVAEPWYSVELLAHVLGTEKKTFENKSLHTKVTHHPLGAYYRLSEIVKYAEENPEIPTKGRKR